MNEKWSPPVFRCISHLKWKVYCQTKLKLIFKLNDQYRMKESNKKKAYIELAKIRMTVFWIYQIFERFFCSINRNSFLYEIVAAVANTQHMHKFMYYFCKICKFIICFALFEIRFVVYFVRFFFPFYFTISFRSRSVFTETAQITLTIVLRWISNTTAQFNWNNFLFLSMRH